MKLRLRPENKKPEPEPIETNATLAVLLGIIAWIVALVLLLIFQDSLADSIPSWWLLACVFGIALGVFGYFKVRNR